MFATLEVFDKQAGAVAADVQRQTHRCELVGEFGEDAASGWGVHSLSSTAYNCQKQWKYVQWPYAPRTSAGWCELLSTCEHIVCATMVRQAP
ncbi:hypothetical protein MDUV_30750 [Mycolicibacterium duvalii]|uniref:Uncharacterized protein n=1 Tax=Mycolicibacterium duvalii TaxID=39688 RepID=A0A7I7K2D8_9MYCO|nr:hypothetical protein MDUV_30750 [Mycolicibacterium duvalii]